MSPREMLNKYLALEGEPLDAETKEKVAQALEALPDPVIQTMPREKLAFCSLEDIVRFQEQGV